MRRALRLLRKKLASLNARPDGCTRFTGATGAALFSVRFRYGAEPTTDRKRNDCAIFLIILKEDEGSILKEVDSTAWPARRRGSS